MGAKSKIEWTDHTFNPWVGCQKVGPACDHCYAEAWDNRYGGGHWGTHAPRRLTSAANWQQPLRWNRDAEKAGKRARVFCCSLADVFDNQAPEGARDRLWSLIRETPWLEWQLLTKRVGNILYMLPEDWGDGYPNVGLMITVVTQEEADRDIPKLLGVPAKWRGLSCEPLLEMIDLAGFLPLPADAPWYPIECRHGYDGCPICDRPLRPDQAIAWVVCGGESGPHARPLHPDWARSLRDQCRAAGVAFHFKQWGEWADYGQLGANGWFFTRQVGARRYGVVEAGDFDNRSEMFAGRAFETLYPWNTENYTGPCVVRVGKKHAGRLLDGRTWDEMPA